MLGCTTRKFAIIGIHCPVKRVSSRDLAREKDPKRIRGNSLVCGRFYPAPMTCVSASPLACSVPPSQPLALLPRGHPCSSLDRLSFSTSASNLFRVVAGDRSSRVRRPYREIAPSRSSNPGEAELGLRDHLSLFQLPSSLKRSAVREPARLGWTTRTLGPIRERLRP